MKKTVRTRRGVEPTGRPARREVELGKKSTNELVQDVRAESWSAALAGCAAGRCHRRGTCVGPDETRSIMGRRRRAVVVVNQSSFEIRHISNISRGRSGIGGGET